MSLCTANPNPFLTTPDRPTVHVAGGCGGYENTLQALAGVDLSPAAGKRVLLKPNVGRNAPIGGGVTTHPTVVAAAIDAFRRAGAEVAVGESPISGVNTLEAFEETGIAAVARERDCPLLDMDARAAVQVPLPNGQALHNLRVCPELFEFDLIVSIPVMKMHMHTGVTLAVKNMKGCLWRRSKVTLHMLPPVPGVDEKPINVAIVDMSEVLRPHLSIVDGTVGMEGLGPSAGARKALDAVVVSADAFAADAVSCELMGLAAESVPHLRMGAERGFGVIALAQIDTRPDQWQQWRKHFAPPPENLSIQYPNITIHDKNSCSACQSSLLLFLKRYGDQVFDYFPKDAEIHLAIGKGHETLPEGTLCIGNCTARHRDKGLYVPGCPPVGSEILSVLSGTPCLDVRDGHSQTDPQA